MVNATWHSLGLDICAYIVIAYVFSRNVSVGKGSVCLFLARIVITDLYWVMKDWYLISYYDKLNIVVADLFTLIVIISVLKISDLRFKRM